MFKPNKIFKSFIHKFSNTIQIIHSDVYQILLEMITELKRNPFIYED